MAFATNLLNGLIMNKLLFTLLLTVFVSGCSSTIDKMAGLGQLETNISDFSGDTMVELSKTRNAHPTKKQASTFFGLKWDSSLPNNVFLYLINQSDVDSNNTYVNYESIEIKIGDDVSTFNARNTIHDSSGYNSVTNTIYTDSKASISIPLSLVEKMVSAEDCRIKINTYKWYEVVLFHVDENSMVSFSRPKFKEFLTKVNEMKAI